MEEIKKLDHPFVEVLWKNNIIYVILKPSAELDLDMANEIYNFTTEQIKTEDRYFHVDIRNLKLISPEARKFYAEGKPSKTIKCMALVSDKKMHKIIYSFFRFSNNPPFPVKIFKETQDAENWIKELSSDKKL